MRNRKLTFGSGVAVELATPEAARASGNIHSVHMSDFLIQIGDWVSTDAVSDALRGREGMRELRISQFRFPWGSAVVQETRGLGYDPASVNDRVCFAVGRPRIIGVTHEVEGPQGFTRRWAGWVGNADFERHYRNLTGLFLLVSCGPEGVELVTDRLGFYAAYVGRDRNGRICAIGTLPNLVARAADRLDDLDLVSVGEFLVRYTPTFPHTTYRGVTELTPGSMHTFDVSVAPATHTSRSLWRPVEPPRYPRLTELREHLTCALRDAGQELTRGAERVAVTLSGGIDSRTVLACVPPEKRAAALTFLDRENYEYRVAQCAAAGFDVPHLALLREREFYAGLPEREAALLGPIRTAMHAHGMVLAGAAVQFDLVLSGLFADALLKCYFAPENVRATLAARLGVPAWLRTRLYARRPAWDDPTRPASQWAVRPQIQRQMQQRAAIRLKEVAAIRPETADEWINFYPASRVSAASYSMGNMRLFASDELFLYRDILEVACSCRPLPKMMERLTAPVFAALCGPLAHIETTKTGLPADLGWLQTRLRLRWNRLLRRDVPRTNGFNDAPWFADHSWVDLRMLQRYSAAWAALRRRAAGAAGVEVLAAVLQIDPRRLLTGFNENLSCEFQVAAVQLALTLGETVLGAVPEPVLADPMQTST